MTQKLLNGTKVGPALQHVSRAAMPKRMRVNIRPPRAEHEASGRSGLRLAEDDRGVPGLRAILGAGDEARLPRRHLRVDQRRNLTADHRRLRRRVPAIAHRGAVRRGPVRRPLLIGTGARRRDRAAEDLG